MIKNIIGYGDGMNHIRAAAYFQKTLQRVYNAEKKPVYKFHFWHWLVYILIRLAAPFYNRKLYSKLYKLKKHLWVFENYKMTKLESLYKKYIPSFEAFYNRMDIENKLKDSNFIKDLAE